MQTTTNPDIIALLHEVASVMAESNLRPDLQQALKMAVALVKSEERLPEDVKNKQVEWDKFEQWLKKNRPHSPSTGHDAQLLWSGWLAKAQFVEPGIFVSQDKVRKIEQILNASQCERWEGYTGEGGGVYRAPDGDFIDIDDAQALMNRALSELKD